MYNIIYVHYLKVAIVNSVYSSLRNSTPYSGELWQEEVWWKDSFQAFGERKFDELIDQSIGYYL